MYINIFLDNVIFLHSVENKNTIKTVSIDIKNVIKLAFTSI